MAKSKTFTITVDPKELTPLFLDPTKWIVREVKDQKYPREALATEAGISYATLRYMLASAPSEHMSTRTAIPLIRTLLVRRGWAVYR